MTIRKRPMIWGKADQIFRNQCIACGREMKTPKRFFIFVANDAGEVVHPDDLKDYDAQRGDGWNELGPECRKKFGDFVSTDTARQPRTAK
jgi:hypothetical protein